LAHTMIWDFGAFDFYSQSLPYQLQIIADLSEQP